MPRTGGLAALVVIAMVSGACAARSTGGPVPRPFPGAALPPAAVPKEPMPPPPAQPVTEDAGTPGPAPLEAPSIVSLVSTALGFRGIPYRNGGSDPSGFDCSGFIQYVFAMHGLPLPREVRDQYRVGDEVTLNEVKPGDLLFFETVSRGASHVGLAIGGDQFVHAPSSRGVVRVESYSASYWAHRFVGARRLSSVN